MGKVDLKPGTVLDVPPAIHVPEPLLGYRCNQKGCCCRGWRIPFKPDDLVRLATYLPPEMHADSIGDGLVIVTDEDHRTIDHIRLDGVGEDDRCRFLEPSGSCGVHDKFGTDALPDLCVEFPVFSFVLGESFELHHQAVCPEVINAMASSEAPFRMVTLEPPLADAVSVRLVRGSTMLGVSTLYGMDVDWEQLLPFRAKILAVFEDESVPALEALGAICHALAVLEVSQDVDAFEIRFDNVDRDRFVAFFFRAMSVHSPEVIRSFFWRARRFMFDHELEDGPQWKALDDHLRDWQDALLRWVEPAEAELRPLLLRYLGHRYYTSPTGALSHDMRRPLREIPLVIALALRTTAAVAACLGRVADVKALKVGMTTAEWGYRNMDYPESGFPEYSLVDEAPSDS